ncbi:MAG: diacylglycerol kinase [Gammaproteobacteria bacterium]|nr:MAG: diacylglycerol kinase [Gammaproteobacteria bacterium]
MTAHKNQSFPRRVRFALGGLTHGLRAENSLKIQVAVFVVAVIAMLILRPGPLWWALVLLASAAVIAAELFNTAIEHLADHLHPQIHPQIQIVKDCAAAAVLVAVLGALAVALALLAHLLTE